MRHVTRAVRMVVLPIRIRRTARLISGRMRTRRDAMMIIMRVMRLRMRGMPSRRCRIGGIRRRSTRLVARRMPRRLELLLVTGGVDLLMVEVMGVMMMLPHARIGRMVGRMVISVHDLMLQIFERIKWRYRPSCFLYRYKQLLAVAPTMLAPKNLVTMEVCGGRDDRGFVL